MRLFEITRTDRKIMKEVSGLYAWYTLMDTNERIELGISITKIIDDVYPTESDGINATFLQIQHTIAEDFATILRT